ncbi:protein diaphanous homolog 3 [Oncorhynchus nerka]|uniref:protein diaphanous homolog 3 n=1 Tax=Oncorhynchus nerka TaxID=8023 RepID=UPI0031B7F330
MDRFASIRIPGSKKERPHLPHVKHSSSSEWSSSSAEFEDLSSKITSEQEILGLFEKMMEDMNLNDDKKAPLREKDLTTKREMVIQYIVTASKTGSVCSSHQISPQEFLGELKSGVTDERLMACLDSLRVSLTSNPVSGVRHYISVLEASLQTLVRSRAVSQPACDRRTHRSASQFGPASSGLGEGSWYLFNAAHTEEEGCRPWEGD